MPLLYPIISPISDAITIHTSKTTEIPPPSSFRHSPMATISGVSLSTPRAIAKAVDSPKTQTLNSFWLNYPWKKPTAQWSAGRMRVRPVRAAPDQISEKVAESIKNAEEACSDDPVSGECVAAWDEVEELSAAASHARDRKKESDPLEEFCKDNPETEECRTYED